MHNHDLPKTCPISARPRPLEARLLAATVLAFLVALGVASGAARAVEGTADEAKADDKRPAATPASPEEAVLNRARQLRRSQKWDEAVAAIESAMASSLPLRKSPALGLEIAQIRFWQGQASLNRPGGLHEEGRATLERSLEAFAKVRSEHPSASESASATFLSGSVHLVLERPARAIPFYRSCYADFPEYSGRARCLLRMGTAQVMLDRIPDALKTYQQVLREFPGAKTQVTKARRYISELSMVGKPFPPLRARRWLNGFVDEQGVAGLPGEVRIVVFVASWCTNCSKEMPHLRRLIEVWSKEGVVWLGAINPADPKNTEPAELYLERSALDFLDVGLVEDPRTWSTYKARSLPAAVLIDRSGKVRWRGHPGLFPVPLLEGVLSE